MSTSLHAAEKSTHRQYDKRPEPSPRMVMLTLLLVTFPIELFFLGFVRLLGWVKLPILFMVFSVIFFCVAVRLLTSHLCV
jgi:solute carrier family 41